MVVEWPSSCLMIREIRIEAYRDAGWSGCINPDSTRADSLGLSRLRGKLVVSCLVL